MHLQHLSLTEYRNFSRLDVEMPAGSIVLHGRNAQGKTSLLEAVYFLATLTSFQSESDRHLINFLAGREPLAVARIVAEYCRGVDSHRLEVRLIKEEGGFNGTTRMRKEVLLDGLKLKIGEAVGRFQAVLFLPQMMRIVDGSPDERRRYLDMALSQVRPAYAPTLSEYRKTVTQRNALLRQLNERGGDAAQLGFWDQKLAGLGARLIFARIRAIKELGAQATRLHQELTRGVEVLRLSYRPGFDPLPQDPDQYALPLEAPIDRSGVSLDEIEGGILEKLAEVRTEEIARGVTTIGPHRDDVRFLSNGVDLGIYGSRGQVRTTLLTLKLAEMHWMREKSGYWPVVLLDEVLAELDHHRRGDLLNRIADCKQVLLTTADLTQFDAAFLDSAELWRIEAGRLEKKGEE